MLQIEKWKVILVILLSAAGVLYALPNLMSAQKQAWLAAAMPGWLPSKTVNLGLDLQGGSHLLLQADTKAVLSERLQTMVDAARAALRKKDIGYTALGVSGSGISFRLRDTEKDGDAAYKIARDLEEKGTARVGGDGVVSVTLDAAAIADINTQVIGQSIEIVRRRIDESGTREPVIQRQGADRIVVQLPGVDDPDRIKALLGKTAKMGFHLLDFDSSAGRPGPGSLRLPMREDPQSTIVIKKRVMLAGDMLVDAQPSFREGAPVVNFRFNAIGARRFCDISRENVGKPFAIVLDDEVISAPVLREPICGGSGEISGSFTVKEANDLALLLRAGALPAPLNVVEERSVGPTLGSDSVAAGKKAAMGAFAAIFVLMLASYGLFGLFANLALVLNLFIIFALFSVLQVTLTLPGLAGIILTMGIAVDTNVLTYERIREEIKNGRQPFSAVDTGYRNALRTILDSNLTTLIVALILFSFGSGPVRGFAVAMSIGIVTSLFSGVMITRLFILAWLKRARPATLSI